MIITTRNLLPTNRPPTVSLEFVDATARDAETYTVDDISRICVFDDGTFWVLASIGPTVWNQVYSAGGDGGAQGAQGFQGAQGIAGAQGSQGPQGAAGTNGSQGAQGAQGNDGAQGFQGDIGVQGNQGFQGVAGSNGSQGAQGTQGSQGVQGLTGSQGSQGFQGAQGFQGVTGSNGTQGSQGFQGTAGSNGSQGAQGTQGTNGSNGSQGSQGITGTNGAQGSQGNQGNQGSAGNNGITNIVTASGCTTLTSTPTALYITPTNYGVTITLPDATTMSKGNMVHSIINNSPFTVRIVNNSGTLLGFIPGYSSCPIGLMDNSTSSGSWSILGSESAGISYLLNAAPFNSGICSVDIGSGREFITGVNSDGTIRAIVYDSTTNTFGASATLRTASITSNKLAAVLSATNQVLVISVDNSSVLEAICCNISGTTITPGTPVSTTLTSFSAFSGTITSGTNQSNILTPCGSAWIIGYTTSTPTALIFAITVSGSTPTIGSRVTLTGTASIFVVDQGGVCVTFSTATTNLYIQPYTISGTTLSSGTGTTIATGTTKTLTHVKRISASKIFFAYNTTATGVVGFAYLSGTTSTSSTAQHQGSSIAVADAIIVDSNKVLFTDVTTYTNIVRDASGTATLGTPVSLPATSSRTIWTDATTAWVYDNTNRVLYIYTVSGNSPVLVNFQELVLAASVLTAYSLCDSQLRRLDLSGNSQCLAGTGPASNVINYALLARLGVLSALSSPSWASVLGTQYYGKNNRESLYIRAQSTNYRLSKLECV